MLNVKVDFLHKKWKITTFAQNVIMFARSAKIVSRSAHNVRILIILRLMEDVMKKNVNLDTFIAAKIKLAYLVI